MDDGVEAIRSRAILNYEKKKCAHAECQLPDAHDLAFSFLSMSEDERVDSVRTILLAISAPESTNNTMYPFGVDRKRSRGSDSPNCSTYYAMRGKKICREAFLAITQISSRTLFTHVSDVTSSRTFTRYKQERSKGKAGKLGSNAVGVIKFLEEFAKIHGCEDPKGDRSTFSRPGYRLPSGLTKSSVFQSYKEQWRDYSPLPDEGERSFGAAASSPVDYSKFVKLWNSKCSNISVSSLVTDYCDTCTTLRNSISNASDELTKTTLQESLEKHKNNARSERMYLNNVRDAAKSGQNQVLHLIMDFAEKVLLPSLSRQPGQLHFVTGLKLDLFAVSCGNNKTNYVFNLPEGHWPGGKTANEVLSMVFHVIKQLKQQMGPNLPKKLVIHADNCAGQNKNRYTLWFCSWMVVGGLFNEVELNFLLPGHTKNECDGAFGCVKKVFRRSDVLCPDDMRDLIDKSAKSASPVSAVEVDWIQWKNFLGHTFIVPKELKLSRFYQFRFTKINIGTVLTRKISTDSTWESFSLMRPSKTVTDITDIVLSDLKKNFAAKNPDLSTMKATKDLTRKEYLMKHICDRYYTGDERFEAKLFSP